MTAAISLRPLHTDTDGHRAYCLACWEERFLTTEMGQAYAARIGALERYRTEPSRLNWWNVKAADLAIDEARRQGGGAS